MTPEQLYADDLMVRWLYQSHKDRHPIGSFRRRKVDRPGWSDRASSAITAPTPLAATNRGRHNRIKTHCPNGHPYDITTIEGWRKCAICHRAAQRRCYERAKQRHAQRIA